MRRIERHSAVCGGDPTGDVYGAAVAGRMELKTGKAVATLAAKTGRTRSLESGHCHDRIFTGHGDGDVFGRDLAGLQREAAHRPFVGAGDADCSTGGHAAEIDAAAGIAATAGMHADTAIAGGDQTGDLDAASAVRSDVGGDGHAVVANDLAGDLDLRATAGGIEGIDRDVRTGQIAGHGDAAPALPSAIMELDAAGGGDGAHADGAAGCADVYTVAGDAYGAGDLDTAAGARLGDVHVAATCRMDASDRDHGLHVGGRSGGGSDHDAACQAAGHLGKIDGRAMGGEGAQAGLDLHHAGLDGAGHRDGSGLSRCLLTGEAHAAADVSDGAAYVDDGAGDVDVAPGRDGARVHRITAHFHVARRVDGARDGHWREARGSINGDFAMTTLD